MQDASDRIRDTTLADRRRPGRLATVPATLLPLLRADERAKLPPLPKETAFIEPRRAVRPERRLGAGEGVLLGVLTGSLLWAAGISAVWSLFR